MSNVLKRGLFHIFVGLSIAVAAYFLSRRPLLISTGVVTFIWLAFELLRLRYAGINSWFFSWFRPLLREEEASRLTGASYMLIGCLITFLVFPRDIAVLAICFLAVGDAAATIVGTYLGTRGVFGKTVEGNSACFVSCVGIGFILYYADLDIHPLAILLGSAGATIVDAVPLLIDDNLTMPLFAGLVIWAVQYLVG